MMDSSSGNLKIENIKKVKAIHGWLWINEGVRYFIQAKYMWLASLFLFGSFTMLAMYLMPISQIALIFIFPFITAGLSLACADMERGQPMTIDYLLKAFASTNRVNIFRYGFVLILMMIVAQLVASILLSVYGISQEQISSEFLIFRNTENASFGSILQSPILSAYFIVTVISMLPIIVINLLSPIILVFTDLTAFQAVKLSIVAGLRNLSTFIVYGVIYIGLIILLVVFFNVFSSLLFSVFGDESIIATIIYLTGFFTALLVLASISYSSAYVAFKDIFLGEEN